MKIERGGTHKEEVSFLIRSECNGHDFQRTVKSVLPVIFIPLHTDAIFLEFGVTIREHLGERSFMFFVMVTESDLLRDIVTGKARIQPLILD